LSWCMSVSVGTFKAYRVTKMSQSLKTPPLR
jgi:hypothetical protein